MMTVAAPFFKSLLQHDNRLLVVFVSVSVLFESAARRCRSNRRKRSSRKAGNGGGRGALQLGELFDG
jgi:hypothetical protein